MKDPRKSIMWSDDWFGPSEGDTNHGNGIVQGRYADWKIVQVPNFTVTNRSSPFGYLRSPWNNNKSPHLTRHRFSCGSQTTFEPRVWDVCANMPTYLAWYSCIDPTVHTWAHSFLGGIWNSARNTSRIECYVKNSVWVPNQYKGRCVLCPRGCTDEMTEKECECSISKENRCTLDHAGAPSSTYGDFADAWTSPNDPIFFPHHANVDRNLMLWQKKHHSKSPTYGFPAMHGPFPLGGLGHALHDVIAPCSPFPSRLIGASKPDFNITNDDLLKATDPLQPHGPLYTYLPA